MVYTYHRCAHAMTDTLADIALVGGGYANTAALYKTLQQLRALKERGELDLQPHQVKMRIYDVRHDLIGGVIIMM